MRGQAKRGPGHREEVAVEREHSGLNRCRQQLERVEEYDPDEPDSKPWNGNATPGARLRLGVKTARCNARSVRFQRKSQLLPRDISIDSSQMHLERGGVASPNGTETGFLEGKIREGVTSALNVDVLEFIAQAWAKVEEMQTAATADRRGAKQPTHLFLAKHDVVCENQLKATLEFAGIPAITDHLNLRLKAIFEGVGVTIENGCIVALDVGRGSAKAELLYSNASLLSQSTDWVTLPARHTLTHPVQIGRGKAIQE